MEILFDQLMCNHFARKVAPVLRAKGIRIATESDDFERQWLSNWFSPAVAVWATTIQVPVRGEVYQCSNHNVGGGKGAPAAHIYDATVRADLTGSEPGGTANIQIQRVMGLTAYATVVSHKSKINAHSESKTILLFSRNGVTVLAEPISDMGCLLACGIWADENIPINIAFTRPESPLRVKELSIDYTPGTWFATDCSKCQGEGEFTVRCKKCSGSGKVDCLKCKGTGTHRSRGGNDYPCSLCNGSGRLECNRCAGTGEKSLPCYPCDGSGVVRVRYEHDSGEYVPVQHSGDTAKNRIIKPEQVYLFDFASARKLPRAFAQVDRILQTLTEHMQARQKQSAAIEAFRCEIEPIATCLERSRDAAGVIERAPIHLTRPVATTERRARKAVYSYSFVRPVPKWIDEERYPFDRDTPLKLKGDEAAIFNADAQLPVLYEIDFANKRFLIAFPADTGRDRIPDNIKVVPDIARSSENTQIGYLRDWIGHDNRYNPVYEAMASGPRETKEASVKLFNESIGRWKSQQHAVEIGVADNPLFLIKGPPGTGKTTIIVEIARQAIQSGRRILVCSQTHQAVRNVLERLHEVGDISMVRHASNESKLSELERQYMGVFGDAETNNIVERADRCNHENEDRVQTLKIAVASLDQALKSAVALDELRKTISQKVDDANRQYDGEAKDWKTQCDAKGDALQRNHKQRRAKLESCYKKCGKTLRALNARIKGCKKDVADYQRRLEGQPPTPNQMTASRLIKLGRRAMDLFPRGIATIESISRRLEKSQKILADAVAAAQKEGIEEQKLKDEMDAADTSYECEKNGIEQSRSERLGDIEMRRSRHLTGLDNELKTGEKPHVVTLKSALDYALQQGLPSPSNQTPDAWGKCLNKAVEDLELQRRRLAFCREWIHDLNANKSEVAAFLGRQVKVFFSTCVGLAGWRDLPRYGITQFDLVIIDEAGHATIPETIIPLSFAKRAILIGDERQLPPVVAADLPCSFHARRRKTATAECVRSDDTCWLERSLFARLWDDDGLKLPRVMLDTQFRMHPLIGDFISASFYEKKLKNGVKEDERHIAFGEFKHPVVIVSTSNYGKERYEVPCNPSFCNPLEATLVFRVVEHLVEYLNAQADKEGEAINVGIITPYKAQAHRLQVTLKPLLKANPRLCLAQEDIASVDKYQGSERDIIIISFVRSPRPPGKVSLEFVQDLKRMNVAFSRARKMLIMVGDVEALSRARGDEGGRMVLERFYDYVKDRGRVLHVWENRKAGHG